MRLAFHDCIPYDDDVEIGNGCDGCLNNDGMNMHMFDEFPNEGTAPDSTSTNNNGLWFTADLLEEIYTDPEFPGIKSIPNLEVSMKDSGKSRADLWAFAGLVAAQMGIEENNLACQGKGLRK